MSNAARVTGTVLKVDVRNGTSAATGQPWSMTTARVLVADEDICDVTVTKDYLQAFGALGKGEEVDLFVTVRASKGYLNIDAVKPFPAPRQAPAAIKP